MTRRSGGTTCPQCKQCAPLIEMEELTDEDFRRMEIQEAATMLGCPYYRGEGHCRSGCSQEPRCITDSPYPDGWEGVLIQAEREEPGSVADALAEPSRTEPTRED